jgi:hypothetical protein
LDGTSSPTSFTSFSSDLEREGDLDRDFDLDPDLKERYNQLLGT